MVTVWIFYIIYARELSVEDYITSVYERCSTNSLIYICLGGWFRFVWAESFLNPEEVVQFKVNLQIKKNYRLHLFLKA